MSGPGMELFVKFSLLFIVAVHLTTVCGKQKDSSKGLKIVTVATKETDGFKRFTRSVKKYDLDLVTLGMGEEWKGGDVEKFPGGGQKIILLKEMLEKVKDKKDLIVMFTDSYDVVLTAGEEEILKVFKKFDARVLFSAEGFCWPDPSLADKYPLVKTNEKRYLNSGGFIGYAPELYRIVTSSAVENTDDDQLFYTNVFLDADKRDTLRIKLDSRGDLFQNLNGALDDVQVKFKGATSYLYNMKTGTQPIVVHGNGPIKQQFNALGNYLGDAWTVTMGCQICNEDTISLEGVSDEDMPKVFVALFLEHAVPFASDFFEDVANLNYPKERIDLFIHYGVEFHEDDVNNFMESYGMKYNSAKVYTPENDLNDWTAHNQALEDCAASDAPYLFTVDAEAHLESPQVLRHLIQTNRSMIAPALTRPGKLWSNFWGALTKDGFYKRSIDYSEIVQGKRKGIWTMPYVSQTLLLHAHRVRELLGSYIFQDYDADMALTFHARNKGVFMYIDNQEYHGFLISSEDFSTEHLNNDLYSLFENKYMWEKKYLHKDFHKYVAAETEIEQPCTDVFWMPIVSVTFCKHLIGEMENFGDWSGGKNKDDRLTGGYENVPTVDIHMNQVGFESHWLQILKDYVAPYNAKLFAGYHTDNRAIMNFVVRYRPGEQDRLRPHHDSSTYTINLALNRPGIDYQGGGVRFHRYNCSVTSLRQGWMFMHPGRLTHLHEGLPTTGGTRYIMVSFIDP